MNVKDTSQSTQGLVEDTHFKERTEITNRQIPVYFLNVPHQGLLKQLAQRENESNYGRVMQRQSFHLI